MDFDDLIALPVKLLSTDPELKERIRRWTRFLLVDEYQDTNHAQVRLIQELVGSDGNLTAVGDEDQGIYRWRGADISNILEFEKTFPDAAVRKLEQNYRSTQTILDVSGALIANNVNRRGKRLWTEIGERRQGRALPRQRRGGRGGLDRAHPPAPAGELQARATWRSWSAPTRRRGRSKTSC